MSLDRTVRPRVGPEPAFEFPSIDHRVNADGLHVWTVARTEAPVVAVAALVPGGSACDPAARRGLTALTADLLDEGTTSRTMLALHEALAGIGAELDTDVNADTTVLSLLALSRHLERALELLADVLLRPRLAADDFSRVRDLRVSRLRQLRDVPSVLADRVFARDLFGEHPYAHTPLGEETALVATTDDEVRAHHRLRFGLQSAHIVIVGDIARDEAHDAVERLFRPEHSEASPAPAVADAGSDGRGHRVVLVDRPGAVQSEVRVGRVAVPRHTPLYFPLLVANAVLGGQFVSRLNTNLRETKGYTYGVRSYFDFRRAAGPFAVATSVQADATADTVREILRELGELGHVRPATAEELSRAKASLTRGYPRGFESAEQVCRGVLMLATHDLPQDYFSHFAESINAVGQAEVTEAARAMLDPSAMRVTVVGDAARVGRELDALGLGDRLALTSSQV